MEAVQVVEIAETVVTAVIESIKETVNLKNKMLIVKNQQWAN
ncbi:MAG: hypothetical protein ACE5ES_04685 [Candidatus Nanoarchaeia archaeon]